MKKQLFVFLLLLAVLLCCGCAQAKQTAQTPDSAPADQAPAEDTASAQEADAAADTPEPAGDETAPEPVEKELPPPPDIDIDSWEYLYAGPYCGLNDYYQPDALAWSQGVYID